MMYRVLLAIVIYLGCRVLDAEGKLCLRNEDIGEREGNMYFCNDPVLSACCEENKQFTCCEAKSNKDLRLQLQLWGCVALFVIILLLLYFYFTNERDVLEGDNFKEAFKNLRIRLVKRQRHAHLLLPPGERQENKRAMDSLREDSGISTGSPVKTANLLNLETSESYPGSVNAPSVSDAAPTVY